MTQAGWTVATIAEQVGGEVQGDGSAAIDGLDELTAAGPGDLTFIGHAKYAAHWPDSRATAALVSHALADDPAAKLEPGDGRALIWVDNADLAMAQALGLFAVEPVTPPATAEGSPIHERAWVDPAATLGQGVCIGPGAIVHAGATLGDGVTLHAGAVVMHDAHVGDASTLWPGAVVRERCVVGRRCILHPNCTIGADGFGFRPVTVDGHTTLMKVPQNGDVRIGDDCEIGANTTIDRAKFRSTVLGDGCKIDNLVQVGHNCVLGRSVVIAGCVALAGSVAIGDGTVIGGMTSVKDHTRIGAGCQVAGGSAVMNDIPDGQTWAGYPAYPARETFKIYATQRHLPEIWKRVKKLR
ncbi:MAG: UDP-3-O-(3-hydroxymyristoyl)glucosamine N-acyltransferase [Planctomycetota bacterium]